MGAEVAAAVQGSMLPCTAMVITTLCRHTQSSGHSPPNGITVAPPFQYCHAPMSEFALRENLSGLMPEPV